eukprot:TRINITY_DN1131_c0_g1_i1.p1 TRINITY_DN1131_c0_g1~~TRINITY_DN1131_c0_g1_i1.p1  ORF type:complete len:271 (-),score=92.83 TRINITY_DN1131_c0_g1_i1:174-950(-)
MEMKAMKGRVAVVTGGGSGIGKVTSINLAKLGVKVAVADLNISEAEKTVAEITKVGKDLAIAVKCDVGSTPAVQDLIHLTVEKFGRIDYAVNCAGIVGVYAKTHEYEEDLFDLMVKVNLKGVFTCMKYEIQQMLKQEKSKHYSIVNISSVAGLVGMRMNAPYTAVKHGVVGMTKAAALDYARANIRVNAICPAPIITPMTTDNVPIDSSEYKKLESGIPLGRLGKPEEVSSAIIWLLSESSSFTTGFALALDGGMSSY